MNSIYRKPGYSVTTDKSSLLHPPPSHHSDTRIYHTDIFQPNSQNDDNSPFFTYLTLSPDSRYTSPPPQTEKMVFYDLTPQHGDLNVFNDIFSSPSAEDCFIDDSEISFDLSKLNLGASKERLQAKTERYDKMDTLVSPQALPFFFTSPTSPTSLPFSSLTIHSPPPFQLRRSERIRKLSSKRTNSAEQEEELSFYYLRSKTCGPGQRRTIAKKVGMKESEVHQWFVNKRQT